MTRNEAVKEIKALRMQYMINVQAEDVDSAFRTSNALGIAITALSGPTREQVEEVFGTITPQLKSDWYGLEENVWVCTKCNMRISSREEGMNFCAVCGSPITHKGMRILMDRLEALYGKAETD